MSQELIDSLVIAAHNVNGAPSLDKEEQRVAEEILERTQQLNTLFTRRRILAGG